MSVPFNEARAPRRITSKSTLVAPFRDQITASGCQALRSKLSLHLLGRRRSPCGLRYYWVPGQMIQQSLPCQGSPLRYD